MQSNEEIADSLKKFAENLKNLYGKNYYVVFLTSKNQYFLWNSTITTIFEDWLFPYGDASTLKNSLNYRLGSQDTVPILIIEFPGWYLDPYMLDKREYIEIIDNFIDKLKPMHYES